MNGYVSMLKGVESSQSIKKMNYDELDVLSGEIREEILNVVSQNGGHLASNLGVVELTIALHRVFDFPEDKLIFDVGHQCYAHKLLSGRADRFDTIRKKDGLSGFTNRFESEFDTLTAGHSGPSVSAGLGLAKSNKILGKDNYVVSVVGDGSFTNGMIYEALNNCCDKELKYIIVLNDNEMSISSNVGNLSKYFSKFRTSKKYFGFKRNLKRFCMRIPVIGIGLVRFFSSIKEFFKKVLLPNNSFFSALGIKYLGPVDGHDIQKLEDVLNEAKSANECCFVIVKTQKGKGYDKAVERPENYHSVGKFNLDEGVVSGTSECFSEVFGSTIVEKASEDSSIVALTAAMCDGTGLSAFSKTFPDRFFDVGIAEEHELAFASGLAAGGMKPVCAVYSTFAQRVYDQAFHDFAIQGLPCVLALDRCGFVPDDGITHQGLFDVSLFSSVPDCTIYSPETYKELKRSIDKSLCEKSVSVVKYPKGKMTEYDRSKFVYNDSCDVCVCGNPDADVVIVSYGRITAEAYKALEKLQKYTSVLLIKLVKIYPVDFDTILNAAENSRLVYVLEEGIKSGGIGEKVAAYLSGKYNGKVVIRAVDNECAFHASTEELIDYFGMTSDKVFKEICANIRENEV